MNPSSDDQTTSSQLSQLIPFHVLEDAAMTASITVTLARHVHEGEFGLFRPPALFEYFLDHKKWEAVAFLLELPLMYEKVIEACGAGPHTQMIDFDALIAVCCSSSEHRIAEAARSMWHGEGTLGELLSGLDADNMDAALEAMRIAHGGGK